MKRLSTNEPMRDAVNSSINVIEMLSFGAGWEAAISGLDELSEIQKNDRNERTASILRWAAHQLRGGNV
jgi:hypothetical protein